MNPVNFFFSFILLSNLELSDRKVHEPYIRALFGTAAHFGRVVVPHEVGPPDPPPKLDKKI
jgi:hypothetical protein